MSSLALLSSFGSSLQPCITPTRGSLPICHSARLRYMTALDLYTMPQMLSLARALMRLNIKHTALRIFRQHLLSYVQCWLEPALRDHLDHGCLVTVFTDTILQVYGLSFASITSVLSHVYFFHWDELVRALKGATKLDIHARLMKPYRKVPIWWWIAIIAIVMAMSIAMTEVFHTGLPVYGIFLAFIIPAIYMVPCGMIQGVTNVS